MVACPIVRFFNNIACPIVLFLLYHCLSHCPFSFISLLVPLSFFFYIIACRTSNDIKENGQLYKQWYKRKRTMGQWNKQWYKRKRTMGQAMI
jgi:hypothetical protein